MVTTKKQIANQPNWPPKCRFDSVIEALMAVEGGYVNNPHDAGGATKYGISLRFALLESKFQPASNCATNFDLDMDGDIDAQDIKALTQIQAKNLYYECFWKRYQFEFLPEPIDGAVFDQAVNGGAAAAIKCLQRAINELLPKFKLADDGVLGDLTLDAAKMTLASFGDKKFIAAYRGQVAARYKAIVKSNPSQKIFLDGWLKRAGSLGNV